MGEHAEEEQVPESMGLAELALEQGQEPGPAEMAVVQVLEQGQEEPEPASIEARTLAAMSPTDVRVSHCQAAWLRAPAVRPLSLHAVTTSNHRVSTRVGAKDRCAGHSHRVFGNNAQPWLGPFGRPVL